jgi:hypothetical protein
MEREETAKEDKKDFRIEDNISSDFGMPRDCTTIAGNGRMSRQQERQSPNSSEVEFAHAGY